MTSIRKILCTLLYIIFCVVIIVPITRADLVSDALTNAQILANAGIIVDNSSNPGSYNIHSSITRREMLKVMLKLAWITPENVCEWKYADLSKDDWWCKYAETALKYGYIASNTNFRPDDFVTKVESLKMIFKARSIDVPKTDDWRVWYVQKSSELWYTNNFSNYDSNALRNFVFIVWGKLISWENQIIVNPIKNIVSYDKQKISLVFEWDMDKISVLSNLKVYPELAYTSNWIDNKNLELTITDLVTKDTDLVVNVWADTKTSDWWNLWKTYVKKFKIDWKAVVDFISPEWSIADLNQYITVRFSKPIVPLTNLDNQEKCPIEITPTLPWKCVWITTSTFQYRPENNFPMWWSYKIMIPSWIDTISWDKTINSKTFTITTPDFELVSNIDSLKKDEKLNFAFNDTLSLEKFKANFSINTFSNDSLDFNYYKWENDLEESKNIITVYPKTWDWGYDKTLTYVISKNLTSLYWNIWLKSDNPSTITTNKLLLGYSPVILLDENAKEKYALSNIKSWANQNIITKSNPSVLLSFYEEVSLDKGLFSSDLPFEIHYVKSINYDDWDNSLIEDKKQILITFSWNINNTLGLDVHISNFNKHITFSTKQENSIVSYKQIDYSKACLTSKNDLGYNNQNTDSFEFDKYWSVYYINEVNKYSGNSNCVYEAWKHKYIVTTTLNPETNYNLTIKKSLLDSDNYNLDKDYNFSFSTPKALNNDKSVKIIDARNLILTPEDVKPLTISIGSVNITKANIKLCVWDLDILSENYLANQECVSKIVDLTNLGFKLNVSVIDLEKIFWKEITKKYITVESSKIAEDRTTSDVKYNYDTSKTSIIISNVSATIKSAKNNILWLHNYSNWSDLTDSISKIESYKSQYKYSNYWSYTSINVTFDKNITFVAKNNWLYELWDWNYSTLLITLKSWEQVILDNVNSYYYDNQNIYNYISTDKPIYKAWEKVNISWLSRILNAEWYDVNTWNLQVSVRDNQWKEVLNKTINLDSLWAFDLSFQLAQDAKLWSYYISIWQNSFNFLVEEYEKPDFEINLTPEKDNYLYWDTAKIDVNWDYYIGLPLANWQWKYNLTSTDYYFDWWKTTWYTFWEQKYFWWDFSRNSSYDSINYVWESSFVLDSKWKTTLDVPLVESSKDKIFILSTTITDPNTKKSISKNTTFKVTKSNVFLWIKFNKYYYAFKDVANIWFVTTDIEWNKLSNKTFKFCVYKVDYKYNKSTYNYDTNEELVLEKDITTDSYWIATESYTFNKYWEYRFEISNWKYKTTKTIYVSGWDLLRPIAAWNNIEVLSDKDGYNVWDNWKITISSPVIGVKALVTIEKLDKILDYAIVNVDSYNKNIPFSVDKKDLPNFRIWVYIIKDVKSSVKALEKLKMLRLQMQEIEEELQKEENYIIPYLIYDLSIVPNTQKYDDLDLLSKLAYLRIQERDLLDQILPDYYFWNKDIKVNIDSIKTSTQIYLDKVSYLPWDSQMIELNISDKDWQPVNWEATVSLIDKSLLALKDNKGDIVNYFYSEKPVSVKTIWNLSNLVKRIDFTKEKDSVEKKYLLKAESINYASDGDALWDLLGSLSDEASNEWNSSNNGEKLRTDFKDVAYYIANVKIVNWKAMLEVPALPDNLTTWVINWYVFTSDTKVWNFNKEFKVQKDLAILPQMPRFFLDWDKTEIGALVVNNTKTQKNVELKLDISGVTIIWKSTKTVLVSPNSSSLVNFEVEIWTWNLVDSRSTDIQLSAISWKLSDSLKVTKPIYPSKTSEYVFTNWSTTDLSYEEKLNFSKVSNYWWDLEISLWATILTNLTKNLDQTLSFPSEDLNSKLTFLRNALVLKKLYKNLWKISEFDNITLQDYNSNYHKVWEVISDVENDIKNYIQKDGGLSYYKDCDKWIYNNTSCSSLDVTRKFLNLDIIVSWVNNSSVFNYYKKALISKIEENKKYNNYYTDVRDFLPIALYKDSDFVSKYLNPSPKLSNLDKLDYIKIYDLLWTSWTNTDSYINDLKNAIYIEARWSILPANKSYYSYDNTVSSAKMANMLMNRDSSEKLFVENLVRFVLSNRDENGNYYTYNFAEVVDSLNKYVSYTHEIDNVNFTADAYLNSKSVLTSKFDESNKYSTDKKVFKFSDYLNDWENSLWFEKTWNWKLYYDVWVRYYLPVTEMSARDEWIVVSRSYYNYDEYNNAYKKECYSFWGFYGNCFIKKVKNIDSKSSFTKWDMIVWEIQIVIDRERNDIVVNDYLPAWAEVLNTDFDTTSNEVKDISWQVNDNWRWRWFDYVEQKDSEIYLYAKHLSAWTYKYTYVLKASNAWTYNLKPATAETLNTPEIWWRSNWWVIEIK